MKRSIAALAAAVLALVALAFVDGLRAQAEPYPTRSITLAMEDKETVAQLAKLGADVPLIASAELTAN